MQLFDELNNDNFMLYAARHYNNPQCTDMDEFNEDVQRFKYLKRLLGRYEKGDLQHRLILNHIIVIYNVFGIDHANKMMFYKMEQKHWSAIKTFLVYLSYLKEDTFVDVPLDENIVEVLRKI